MFQCCFTYFSSSESIDLTNRYIVDMRDISLLFALSVVLIFSVLRILITEEIDALRANQIPQLPSEPSKVNQIFQFVRRVGFHVGSTIVKYNLISHM